MNKQLYIEEVSEFIDYFARLIAGEEFRHQFQLPAQSEKNKEVHSQTRTYEGFEQFLKTDRWLFITNLEEAYKKYWWDKKNYQENKKILDELQHKIKAFHNKLIRDPQECYELVKEVFDWGGVWNRNKNHVNKIVKKDLLQQIENGINEMTREVPNLDVFDKKRSRMNAGYTKYYSLACEEVIIYDGRVGAALGLITKEFLRQKLHSFPKAPKVPEKLSFQWGRKGSEKTQGKQRIRDRDSERNPSDELYKFSKLSGDRKWAQSNIRANWIIVEALRRAKRINPEITWASEEIDIRMIEAALFTIGYSL